MPSSKHFCQMLGRQNLNIIIWNQRCTCWFDTRVIRHLSPSWPRCEEGIWLLSRLGSEGKIGTSRVVTGQGYRGLLEVKARSKKCLSGQRDITDSNWTRAYNSTYRQHTSIYGNTVDTSVFEALYHSHKTSKTSKTLCHFHAALEARGHLHERLETVSHLHIRC